MAAIILTVEDLVLEAELYEGQGSEALLASLPADLKMSRWGDEYYGRCSAAVEEEGDLRDLFEVGEIAFWPPGKAFCIFFGPTPMSSDSRPVMASPGVPLGKIKANWAALKKLDDSVRVKVTRK